MNMKSNFWTKVIFEAMSKLDKKERLIVIVALIQGAICIDGFTEADIFNLKDKTAEISNIIADYHNLRRAGSDNNIKKGG